jgi:hypothetical protein
MKQQRKKPEKSYPSPSLILLIVRAVTLWTGMLLYAIVGAVVLYCMVHDRGELHILLTKAVS